jgi:hypothetical protein
MPKLPTVETKRAILSHVNAWWKPWICQASPFGQSLWIDADAVLTGDPAPLFDRLTETPMLVGGQRPWHSSSGKMRYAAASHFFGKAMTEKVLPQCDMLNTGVIAWRRGAVELAEFQDWCLRLMNHPETLELCTVRDQTGMLLMCCDRAVRGLQPPPILEDEWNWPADGLPGRQALHRKPIDLDPAQLLQEATARHSGARIVHWLARPKPWGIGK